MSVRVQVDQNRLRELQSALTNMFRDGGKIADKATRAGYRKTAVPVARNLRRETRSAGYRDVAKSIGSQLTVKKKGKGREYALRVGVKKKNKVHAAIWHWLNLGVSPHFQPNAWRPVTSAGGQSVLVKVPGGARHPGFVGKQMRNRAARVSVREATQNFEIGFFRTTRRELIKRGRRV